MNENQKKIQGHLGRHGWSFGSAMAIAISWSAHKSILWAILHGVFGWKTCYS